MKHGYKLTELGVIPVDWEVQPLKKISPRQSVGLVINPSTYFDRSGTVPLLVGSDVAENFIDSGKSNRITQASNELLSASRLQAGDIVMVRVGEPGVAAVVPPQLDQCNCASMMIVRKHPSFNSHWLCYAMNSQNGRRQVEHVQYGTAQKQFNISDAIDFRYPVPPLSEQRAIAAALSDVDALLGGLDRLISKKRNLKQAAMQQLLTGQTRLPGFDQNWELNMLRDIGKFKNGLNKDSGAFGHGSPFVNLMDVFGVNTISSTSHLGLVASTKPDQDVYDLRRGDVIFIRSSVKPSGIGLTAVVERDLAKTVFSGFLIRFRDNGFLDIDFKKYCFYEESFRKKVIAVSSASANTNINQNALGQLTLLLPPTQKEQAAVAAVLSDIDAELSALEARRDKTRALKQAMMQELLTGRTRLISHDATCTEVKA